MAIRGNPTAKYKVLAHSDGNQYRFFCEVCGIAVVTTKPIRAETPEMERSLAWEQEGKAKFNRCPKCGRYVCDTMYNADVCECVACSPWENKPKFCKRCGREMPKGNRFCGACGTRARYGEVWE